MTQDNLKAFTIRVPTELIDWLEQRADKAHRSRTGEVLTILTNLYLSEVSDQTAARP